MHDLAGDPVALGDPGNREPVGKNLHYCLVALLHDAQLHEHCPDLPVRRLLETSQGQGRAEVSSISRSRVTRAFLVSAFTRGSGLSRQP
jgi:hypothetical protein